MFFCLDVAILLLDLEVAMKSVHVKGNEHQVAVCSWLMFAPPRPWKLQIHRQKQKCGRGLATDACHMFDCVILSVSLKSQLLRISNTLETYCAYFVLGISHQQSTTVHSSIFFIHSFLKFDGCEVSCGFFAGSKAVEQPPMSLNSKRVFCN